MIKNYLKIAWKVLLRRKFFTAISLFGISFTLAILLLATVELDSILSATPPESKIDRLLYIKRLIIKDDKLSRNVGFPSYYFLNRYVKTLRTPEKVSVYSMNTTVNFYHENNKIRLELKYTDRSFWEILDFVFLEGRAITKDEVNNAERVVVISKNTREQLFGNKKAVGESIELKQIKYRIVGVVDNVLKTRSPFAEIWAPITTSTSEDFDKFTYMGNCEAMLLASKSSDDEAIKKEFLTVLSKVELMLTRDSTKKIVCPIMKSADWIYDHGGKYEEDKWFNYVNREISFMVLFMLLPALNLININISRIIERSSEIAVRKAFGASTGSLIIQFLTENIIVTLLGSIIGIIFGYFLVHQFSSLIGLPVSINYRVVLYYLGAAFLFGLLSGVYPAYKMSKVSPIKALRGDI